VDLVLHSAVVSGGLVLRGDVGKGVCYGRSVLKVSGLCWS
jgi:hypothetical protein